MKKNNYVKFSLVNHSDDDAIYNMFYIYFISILECIFLVLMIGEINIWSGMLLLAAACMLCYLAYKKGCQDAIKKGRCHHE